MGKWKPKAQQAQQAQVAGQYEKIPGTAIKMLKGGIPVRVVHASGKEFSPNNIQGAWSHMEKLQRSQGGKGQSNGQRKGAGKGVIKTQVKQAKGKGKTQGKTQGKGQAKGQGKNQQLKQQKGGGKGQVQFQAPQKKSKGGGKGKGGKAVKAPVKFKAGGFAATMVKKKNLKNGKGAGKGKGGKGGKQGKKKKPMSAEKLAEFKEKRAERHATKIEKEMRMLVSDTYYTGEIVARQKYFCWVLPQSPPLPASVMPELKKMNDEFRAKSEQNLDGRKARPFANGCEGNVVYVALADLEEESLKPTEGTAVRFKLYTDSKGVGGCEVVSA